MPTCAAAGCNAGSKKDVFKVFPRKDWKRRQIWIERVNRPGWLPNKYSSLCERHFDHEQWEIPREDGKRKLKSTAVPTIFCVQHPSEDDVVAKDHSYCILGYRQLYDISDSSDKNDNDCTTLFEHIKVEVNDTELFATESLEEENNELFSPENVEVENDREVGNDEEAENIQCTPDISYFPEPNEPEPIEMVHCEENETNTSLAEPSFDPLAISAEDRKYAQTDVPHFHHAKKFVFVQKDKRIMVPTTSTEVAGEPAASVQKPVIKILSPQQLCKLPLDSHLPDLNAQNVTSNLKGLPKLQVGFIKRASMSPETEVDPQQLPGLDKHPFPEKVKTNYISGNSKIFKHPEIVKKILIPKPPPLTPSPTFLQNSKTVGIPPNSSRKFIKVCSNPLNRQSSPKFLFPKKNLNIDSHYESGFLKEFEADIPKPKWCPKLNPISNSMDVCEMLEKVYLDHEYLDKTPWRPVSMDGMKIVKEASSNNTTKNVYRFIGNNDVKMWLTKNCPPAGSNTGTCVKTTKFKVTEPSNCTGAKKVDGVCVSGSSVVVLKPFEKSNSGKSNKIKLISSLNNQNINLFLCSICRCSFLTMPSLKLHLNSHTKEKTNQENTSFTDESGPINEDKEMKQEGNKQDVDKPKCNVENDTIQEEGTIMTLGKNRPDVVTSTNDLEQKTFVKSNDDGSNKIDDVKSIEANFIPKDVELKRLVVNIPKLNVNPEMKPAIQSKRVTTDLAKSSFQSNKNVLKTYGLRQKTKLMQTKLIINKCKEKNKQTIVYKGKEKNKLSTVNKNKERYTLTTVHKYKEKNKLTTVHKYKGKNKLTTVLQYNKGKFNSKNQSTASSKPNSKKTEKISVSKSQSTVSSKRNSKKTETILVSKNQSTASSKLNSKKTETISVGKSQSTVSSKCNSKKTETISVSKSQSTASSSKPNSKKTETVSVIKSPTIASSKPNSKKTETVSVIKSPTIASSKPNSKKNETIAVSKSQLTASSKPNSKKTETQKSTKLLSLIKIHNKRGKVDGKKKPISTTTKNNNKNTGKGNTSKGNNKLQENKGKIIKTNDVKPNRNSIFSVSKPSHPFSAKYACEICDKRFYKKFLLQRHSAKEHEKEDKPYKCDWKLCDMKFLSKRQSNNHSKICSKRPP